jgi:DNA-binding LacI/PurR family transcriptional regulator
VTFNPSKTPDGGARTVGILASGFVEPFVLRILQGAVEELRRAEFSIVCFDGGFPNAPLFRTEDGGPVLPIAIDGWIVLPETLRAATGDLERAIAASYRPAVSIGAGPSGVASIAANDETGVFQAVAHLARRHGRTRIAFIGGPEASLDAARRREGYQIALESLKLQADPVLMVVGDYEVRSGREAVAQLRRHGGLPFDAIVAANDLMAIGALEALRAGGVRVPEDVSVVGFDDTEEASFAAPPLTTVRQPLYEQGAAAARLLMRTIADAPAETNRTVGTTPLVIRRSCGCRSSSGELTSSPPGELKKDQELVGGALRERMRHELAQARRHRDLSRIAGDVLRALDFPQLCPAMTEVMALLELKRLFLCSYAGAQRHARIALESMGQSVVFHHQSRSYGVEQALPPIYLNHDGPFELSIGPLELADEHFGYLVIEGDLQRSLAYLDLRRHLGSALGRMVHGRELRRLYGERRRTELGNTVPSVPPPRK